MLYLPIHYIQVRIVPTRLIWGILTFSSTRWRMPPGFLWFCHIDWMNICRVNGKEVTKIFSSSLFGVNILYISHRCGHTCSPPLPPPHALELLQFYTKQSMCPQPQHMMVRMYPHSKVHGANMGRTWVLSVPDGSHVGPTDHAIRVVNMLSWDRHRQ